MTPSDKSHRNLDPMTAPQHYVRENRDDLIKLIKHGDPFIRTLGLAILFEGGQEADIDSVIRELKMIKQLDEEDLSSH